MIVIGTVETLLGVFIIVIAYAAYTTIKQLRTLESTQTRRVLDLMVISAILYLLDFLMPQERAAGRRLS